METIIPEGPSIYMKFNRHILSMPSISFNAEKLRQISDWLLEQINSAEFHKFPSTIVKLKQQHQKFMDLYECAKIEERNAKEKTFIKAKSPFYRPRFANRNDQYLFERLDDRRRTSKYDRENNEI